VIVRAIFLRAAIFSLHAVGRIRIIPRAFFCTRCSYEVTAPSLARGVQVK
jgi:hypothetical protein